MNSQIDVSFVAQFHELCKRITNGSLDPKTVRFGLQLLIEHQPVTSESLSNIVLLTIDGIDITEEFLAQTMTLHGQKMRRHRNGGGWVPADQDEFDESKPFVADTAYISPHAMVFGNARVTDVAWIGGRARVFGYARVFGKAHLADTVAIYDSAWVYGNASVTGQATLRGRARVYDNARLYHSVTVAGNAHVFEEAWMYEDAQAYGNSRVHGRVRVRDDVIISDEDVTDNPTAEIRSRSNTYRAKSR